MVGGGAGLIASTAYLFFSEFAGFDAMPPYVLSNRIFLVLFAIAVVFAWRRRHLGAWHKRLLVLGQTILPLCGHDPAQGSPNLQSFNHEGGRVPALHEAGLDRLLAKPALRARLWQRWLDWTDGQTWDEPHG